MNATTTFADFRTLSMRAYVCLCSLFSVSSVCSL